MPGPFGAYGAALGNVMSGQADAAQQMEMQRQLMQQRQVDEMIRRQQALMQMQAFQEQNEAMKTLSPEDRKAMVLGESYSDILKNKNATQARNFSAEAFRSQAVNEVDPKKQYALSMAADMLEKGANETTVNEFLRINGLSSAVGTSALAQMTAEHPNWTTEQKLAAIAKAQGRGSETELKPVYDPNTGVTTWTYVPKAGTVGTTAGVVRPTLGSSPQAEIETAATGMDRLQGITQQLMSKSGGLGGFLGAKGAVAERAMGLPTDPVMGDFLGQVSTIDSSLTGMVTRAWGSRNVSMAQQIIKYHVPHVGDSPALVAQKLQEWRQPGGYLDQYKQMVGMAGGGAAPANAGGRPVYDATGKIIGYTTDGKTMTPVGP